MNSGTTNHPQQSATSPVVSVIIPVYNNSRYIAESVESVLKQTYRDFELIVVDDGSTDDTPEALEIFGDRIRYVRKANGGPASARNAGIRLARGKFLAFQDADDIWLPEKLELQMEHFERNPEYGVIFTGSSSFDEKGHLDSNIKEGRPIPTGMIFDRLLTEHFIAMSTVVVRRSCIEEVGLFDESLIGAEDYNLFLRLARRYPFGFVGRVLLHKRWHGKNLSEDLKQMCFDEIKNLQKIAALFPDMKIPTRRLIAGIYLRFGKYYFAQKRFSEARGCFQQALQHSPLLTEAWVFLTVSSLPSLWRNQLLSLRKMRMRAN